MSFEQHLCVAACLSGVLQISARNQPRTNDGQQWAKDYHTRLYNLTDDAVRGQSEFPTQQSCFGVPLLAHNLAAVGSLQHTEEQTAAADTMHRFQAVATV